MHNMSQLMAKLTRGNNTLDVILIIQPPNAVNPVLEEISDHRAIDCFLHMPIPDKTLAAQPIHN